MRGYDGFDNELGLLFDQIVGPGALHALERQFWLDLFRAPCLDAVEERGIEVRHYGPVLSYAIADSPRSLLFNLTLGASRPGAVEGGHLGQALDWVESLGVDSRIPLRLDFGEPESADDLLNRRGYRRPATLAMFVRGGAPPSFPEPQDVRVDPNREEDFETFTHLLSVPNGLDWFGDGFLGGLSELRDWRSYLAVDEKTGWAAGAATMMLHYEVAQLGFAGVHETVRRRGVHLALIRRRIVDALAAGARQLFAVTEEAPDFPDTISAGARNLLRAGFTLSSARPLWRPPEDLIAGDEDGGDELEDQPPDEGDEDHDFELGV
jgi:hypothetical protein